LIPSLISRFIKDPSPEPAAMTEGCKKWFLNLGNDLLVKLTGGSLVFPQQDSKFLSASGFLPGRMGHAGDCISVPGMNYWLLTFGPIGSSMCVPEICTESDVQAIISPLTKVINPTGEAFVPRVSTMEIMSARYKEVYKPGTGFWITVSFIVLFTVFSIVATLCNQISKHSQQKQKEKEKETLHFRANYETDELDLNGISQQQSFKQSDTKPGQTAFQDSTLTDPKQKAKIGEMEAPLIGNSAQSKPKAPTLVQEIMQAFDFVDRWNLLRVSRRPTVENGAFDLIKVISMAWVVIAHAFAFSAFNSPEIIDKNYYAH
jgi:hypothetical protein